MRSVIQDAIRRLRNLATRMDGVREDGLTLTPEELALVASESRDTADRLERAGPVEGPVSRWGGR